jgi:hypothetical protein
MCEKAVEIQEAWELTEMDEYCEQGDHEDDLGEEVHLGTLTDDEKEDIKANKVWLPLLYQIRKRLFYRFDVIRESAERAYTEYMRECRKDEEKTQKIRKHFKRKEVDHVIALMFVMERDYGNQWDFEKQDWIKIER